MCTAHQYHINCLQLNQHLRRLLSIPHTLNSPTRLDAHRGHLQEISYLTLRFSALQLAVTTCPNLFVKLGLLRHAVFILLLLLLLFTAIEFSLGGSSPYTSNK